MNALDRARQVLPAVDGEVTGTEACPYRGLMLLRYRSHEGPVGMACLRCGSRDCGHRGDESVLYGPDDFGILALRKRMLNAG